jgi:hypothetical protein
MSQTLYEAKLLLLFKSEGSVNKKCLTTAGAMQKQRDVRQDSKEK